MALSLTPNLSALHPLSCRLLKYPTSSSGSHALAFHLHPKSSVTVSSSLYSFSDAADPSPPPDSGAGKPEFVDEWGEKSPEETEPSTKFPETDPPREVDEWGESRIVDLGGNGNPESGGDENAIRKNEEEEEERITLRDLKRALVDTVYGTDLGFRASPEIRAEALELVSQLEAANPTPAPTGKPELLEGNWILVFTAFSELLPLLAVNSIPLVKLEKIVQSIDATTQTLTNSATISTPASTSSFSASASFEIRSPSRIQVQFKEGIIKPPELKSTIDLPESINIAGQNISLAPLQQALNPLGNALQNVSVLVSGLGPVKIPIPGERTSSWLLTTYLDEELRISRGDGGLFVLVKEGSSLLW